MSSIADNSLQLGIDIPVIVAMFQYGGQQFLDGRSPCARQRLRRGTAPRGQRAGARVVRPRRRVLPGIGAGGVPRSGRSAVDAARSHEEAAIQANAVAASERSLTLANNRYRGGVTSYLEVITAQQAALANERAAVNILIRRMNATVLLLKGLGGGWNGSMLPAISTR